MCVAVDVAVAVPVREALFEADEDTEAVGETVGFVDAEPDVDTVAELEAIDEGLPEKVAAAEGDVEAEADAVGDGIAETEVVPEPDGVGELAGDVVPVGVKAAALGDVDAEALLEGDGIGEAVIEGDPDVDGVTAGDFEACELAVPENDAADDGVPVGVKSPALAVALGEALPEVDGSGDAELVVVTVGVREPDPERVPDLETVLDGELAGVEVPVAV